MRTTSVSCAVSAGPYRADIDGLRAVSIVSVVLYHVGVPYVSGGFVGVDVFFVISGYLITSIVLAEMKAGTFSFARFYERRMRRLLPTLVVVLGTAFAVSFLIMVPEDFEQFCKSMFYVLILAANLFFLTRAVTLILRCNWRLCSIFGRSPWRSSFISFGRSFCWR